MNAVSSSRTLPPRAQAARIVAGWIRTGRFPDREVDAVTSDHGQVLELVLGVVRWRWELRNQRGETVVDLRATSLFDLAQV